MISVGLVLVGHLVGCDCWIMVSVGSKVCPAPVLLRDQRSQINRDLVRSSR